VSRQTQKWLENNILVGFTEKRGNAWWYRGADRIDGSPNHFPLAIPVSTVEKQLFNWEPVSVPLLIPTSTDSNGYPAGLVKVPGKQAIVASDDPSTVLGIFSDGYQPHDYRGWLLDNVSTILGDTLQISSAGLLRNRGVAWVEISVPDTITTPEGISFRPNLLATTSLDGTVATTYKRTVTMTVCDNTWGMAMSEKGQTYRRKHTRNSAGKLEMDKARDMLALVHKTADTVEDELRALCEKEVTDAQFRTLMEQMTAPTKKEQEKSAPFLTRREKKMGELWQLWTSDARVRSWRGTAFGAVQAFNTWEHHLKNTYGDTTRVERNMLWTVQDKFVESDADVMSTLNGILAASV
jgi:phage/plasmid-like protein (TIGR03299 family)